VGKYEELSLLFRTKCSCEMLRERDSLPYRSLLKCCHPKCRNMVSLPPWTPTPSSHVLCLFRANDSPFYCTQLTTRPTTTTQHCSKFSESIQFFVCPHHSRHTLQVLLRRHVLTSVIQRLFSCLNGFPGQLRPALLQPCLHPLTQSQQRSQMSSPARADLARVESV
jgi:hypothetical protein